MAEVHPITEKQDIKRIYQIFTDWGQVREAELFMIGCHVGLRIGDLLTLRFADVQGSHIHVTEQKTGKKRQPIPISPVIRRSIDSLKKWYAEKYPEQDIVYLFQSISNRTKHAAKAIDPSHVRKEIKHAAKEAGLVGNYSSHTLRKTWAYQQYMIDKNVTKIQRVLNHSSELMTLSYIGVTRQLIDKMYMDLDLSI